MYKFITNPINNKKLNIFSKNGIKLLKKYIKVINGGATKKDLGLACMVFGRFQPPHKSHGELIDLVRLTAEKEGGKAFVFTSQSYNNFEDPKILAKYQKSKSAKTKKKMIENPIEIRDKLELLRRLHGHKSNLEIVDMINEDGGNIKSPFHAVPWLHRQGYSKIIFFAGTDRIKAYRRLEELFPYLELRELPRPEESVSGTRVRTISLSTITEKFNYIMSEKLLNSKNIKLTEEDLVQIKNIINLYIDIKGHDECSDNIIAILTILEKIQNANESTSDKEAISKSLQNLKSRKCTENLLIIRHMVKLIQEGTIL